VERFCDQALWLDRGKTRAEGEPRRVVAAYIMDVEKTEEQELARDDSRAAQAAADVAPATGPLPDNPVETAEAPANMFRATEGRWGSREIEITDVVLVGADGQPGHVFHAGGAVEIRLKVRAHQAAKDFVFGFGLFNADGVCCYGTNTHLEQLEPRDFSGEGEVCLSIDSLDLVEGTYKLDLAVHKQDGYPYDYHRLLYTFRVKSRTKDVGIYRPAHRWTFTPNIRFKDPRPILPR
jgi:hypothetical protein